MESRLSLFDRLIFLAIGIFAGLLISAFLAPWLLADDESAVQFCRQVLGASDAKR